VKKKYQNKTFTYENFVNLIKESGLNSL